MGDIERCQSVLRFLESSDQIVVTIMDPQFFVGVDCGNTGVRFCLSE